MARVVWSLVDREMCTFSLLSMGPWIFCKRALMSETGIPSLLEPRPRYKHLWVLLQHYRAIFTNASVRPPGPLTWCWRCVWLLPTAADEDGWVFLHKVLVVYSTVQRNPVHFLFQLKEVIAVPTSHWAWNDCRAPTFSHSLFSACRTMLDSQSPTCLQFYYGVGQKQVKSILNSLQALLLSLDDQGDLRDKRPFILLPFYPSFRTETTHLLSNQPLPLSLAWEE